MQRGGERVWKMCAAGFALLVCGAHAEQARGARADDTRGSVRRVRGDYEATAADARAPGLELALESGFSVLLRGLSAGSLAPDPRSVGAAAGLSLRVARQRVSAVQIAPAFVPIGPTVELSAKRVRFDAAFSAEHFRVRAGHRLVLAVEHAGGCADTRQPGCWRALEARYEGGRCVARGVEASGLRLQFGSLPALSDGFAREPGQAAVGALNGSAAP